MDKKNVNECSTSALTECRLFAVMDEAEVLHGLKLLCEKYSPGLDHTEELAKCGGRVKMLRFDIAHISGKEAIELVRNRKP